jgi:hypothetical protein
MVIETNLKEDKDYWCLMDCAAETPYYFNSESAAKTYAKKHKLKDFIIGLENG